MKPALAAKHPRSDPGQSFGYSDLSSCIIGTVWSHACLPRLCQRASEPIVTHGGRATLQEAGSAAYAVAECGSARGADASRCAMPGSSLITAPCLLHFAEAHTMF